MGHYYAQDGTPAYFTNGKDTTLREARKLGLVPSTTEVLAIIAKPALETYKENQSIAATLKALFDEMAAGRKVGYLMQGMIDWVYRKVGMEPPIQSFFDGIKLESKRQAQEAADRGSYIHDQLERDRNGESVDDWCKPTCARVRELLSESFPGVHDWVTEKPFAHPGGYGGRVDLHSPSTGIICDYKGKDGVMTQDAKHAYWQTEVEPEPKRCDYDQFWQLASYQQGLGFQVAQGANIFFSRTDSGQASIKVWTPKEMQQGRDTFNAALALWKVLNKYDGSFEKRNAVSGEE